MSNLGQRSGETVTLSDSGLGSVVLRDSPSVPSVFKGLASSLAGKGKVKKEAKKVSGVGESREGGKTRAVVEIGHTGSVMTITQKQHEHCRAEALGESGRYDQSRKHVEQREVSNVLEIMALEQLTTKAERVEAKWIKDYWATCRETLFPKHETRLRRSRGVRKQHRKRVLYGLSLRMGQARQVE